MLQPRFSAGERTPGTHCTGGKHTIPVCICREKKSRYDMQEQEEVAAWYTSIYRPVRALCAYYLQMFNIQPNLSTYVCTEPCFSGYRFKVSSTTAIGYSNSMKMTVFRVDKLALGQFFFSELCLSCKYHSPVALRTHTSGG
jgi:hypothetical protein